MTMNCNLCMRLSTRNFQPGVKFNGSTFACPGFDSSRSVTDAHLRDQCEQGGDITAAIAAQTARDPRLFLVQQCFQSLGKHVVLILGVVEYGPCAIHEKPLQIGIATLADPQPPLFPSRAVLAWRASEGGGKNSRPLPNEAHPQRTSQCAG